MIALAVFAVFLCKIAVKTVYGQCPSGGWQFDSGTNTCYNVYVNMNPGLDYTDSISFCAAQSPGAQLASCSTAAVQSLLMSMSSGATLQQSWCNSQLQLGMSWVSGTNHTFYWTDCQPWNSYSQTLWSPGEPDNFGGKENTGQLTLFTFFGVQVGKINDCTGSELIYNVACEIQLTPLSCSTTTTTGTTTTAQLSTTTMATTTTMAPTTTAATTTIVGATTTTTIAGTTTTTTTVAGATTTTTKATTTTILSPTCCPSGGIWSQWTVGKCISRVQLKSTNGTCGSCGNQMYTRTCLSDAKSCPCKGKGSLTAPCGPDLCAYPDPTCCSGYHEMVYKKKYVCGPITTVAKSVTATCPMG